MTLEKTISQMITKETEKLKKDMTEIYAFLGINCKKTISPKTHKKTRGKRMSQEMKTAIIAELKAGTASPIEIAKKLGIPASKVSSIKHRYKA